VTDAIAAAGAGDGSYTLAGIDFEVENGVARRADSVLAGSTVPMIEAVRNLVTLGAPLGAALAAASEVPARIAGRPELGSLDTGTAADVVVLDDTLEIMRVLAAGEDASG
jgi:N-acetylglucosamine-6-phosphate deacetylase